MPFAMVVREFTKFCEELQDVNASGMADRGVNVGGGGVGGWFTPPREMIQSVSNYVQSVSKLCVCLHAVLCEAN